MTRPVLIASVFIAACALLVAWGAWKQRRDLRAVNEMTAGRRRASAGSPPPLPRRQRAMPPGHPDRGVRLSIDELEAWVLLAAMYDTEGEIR